jgi:leucyl aminopeptidase (aminopeptidase T)
MVLYEYELGKAADILTGELFKLKPGETFVITADTESNPHVVDATARAAFSIGAKPMVIWLASPLGVGKLADPMLPVDSLLGALKGADAWVEFNNQWLLYSTPHEIAMKENKKLRYLNLVGMNPDMMVRCIGRVNHPTLKVFLEKAAEKIRAAENIHMTSPKGTDLEFKNVEGRGALVRDGYADKPGTYMMAGFIS